MPVPSRVPSARSKSGIQAPQVNASAGGAVTQRPSSELKSPTRRPPPVPTSAKPVSGIQRPKTQSQPPPQNKAPSPEVSEVPQLKMDPPQLVSPAPYPANKSLGAPSGLRPPGSIRTSSKHMRNPGNTGPRVTRAASAEPRTLTQLESSPKSQASPKEEQSPPAASSPKTETTFDASGGFSSKSGFYQLAGGGKPGGIPQRVSPRSSVAPGSQLAPGGQLPGLPKLNSTKRWKEDHVGYATDTDVLRHLDDGENTDSAGYMSEGGGGGPQLFKNGMSVIKDFIQRSEIRLDESGSDGEDGDSISSNISDLVNDLSSDISASIASPFHTPSPAHVTKHVNKPADKVRSSDDNTDIERSSTSTESVIERSVANNSNQQQATILGQSSTKTPKKTAIVNPQKHTSRVPPNRAPVKTEARSTESFISHSSAESSPLAQNKGSPKPVATIKRCPTNSEPRETLKPESPAERSEPSPKERLPEKKSQEQPLIGQIRGNVFRLSSTSSVVSEEHEDSRSSEESHRRNSNCTSTVSPAESPRGDQIEFSSLQVSQQSSRGMVRKHQSPVQRRRRPPQIESDIEWESASISSFRSNSSLTQQWDKSCFSDTEDLGGKLFSDSSSRILANNPTMRKFLESRAALARDQSRVSGGGDIFESSFALRDIRNLRDNLANPSNIETQSDYGFSPGRISSRHLQPAGSRHLQPAGSRHLETAADHLLDKFSILNSLQPGGDVSAESIRHALTQQYAHLPLTQDLLNRSGADPHLNRYSAVSDAHSSETSSFRGGAPHSTQSAMSPFSPGRLAPGCSPAAAGVQGSSLSNALGELAALGRDDNLLCGSSLSINSASSLDSTSNVEEKQMQETIRRLKTELILSNEKVNRLTSHLITNAETVARFERALTSVNVRLLAILPDGSEGTAAEIDQLRAMVQLMKQQHHSLHFLQPQPARSRDHARANSLDYALDEERHRTRHETPANPAFGTLPHPEKQSPTPSHTSAFSGSSSEKKQKKNWLRSTFKLGRKKSPSGGGGCSASDVEDGSVPGSPGLRDDPGCPGLRDDSLKCTNSASKLYEGERETQGTDLRGQLRENERKLTETKLQYLSSVHQVDHMKDQMHKLKSELEGLRAENERLAQRRTSPSSSVTSSSCCRHSSSESCSGAAAGGVQHANSEPDLDGGQVRVRVRERLLGTVGVTGDTSWAMLDGGVRAILTEYLARLDPDGSLGLGPHSFLSYSVAGSNVERTLESSQCEEEEAQTPLAVFAQSSSDKEHSVQVAVRDHSQWACDWLVLETCVPKQHLQRYISQLTELRRLLLVGPAGTGKSFTAASLAQHMVQLGGGGGASAANLVHVDLETTPLEDVKQLLNRLQHTQQQQQQQPVAVVLDNLHAAAAAVGSELSDLLASVQALKQPNVYLLATMTQQQQTGGGSCYPQLHAAFPRWVMCASHLEPVSGLLSRLLRRSLLEQEACSGGARSPALAHLVEWLPQLWRHVNRLIETFSSTNATIGPAMLLGCPMDLAAAHTWFVNVWNYSLAPYLAQVVREGLHTYGVPPGASWEDPLAPLEDSYPWAGTAAAAVQASSLVRLRQEDVGFDKLARMHAAAAATNMQYQNLRNDSSDLASLVQKMQQMDSS